MVPLVKVLEEQQEMIKAKENEINALIEQNSILVDRIEKLEMIGYSLIEN